MKYIEYKNCTEVFEIDYNSHNHFQSTLFDKRPEDVLFFSRIVTYQINWNLTQYCNYNCSYCSQREHNTLNKQKQNKQDIELLLYRAKIINNFIKNNKYFTWLNTLGGEITLYNDLYKIFDVFNKNKYLTGTTIVTNGSRNESYYIDLINRINYYIAFTFSFHEEFANIDSFFKKIININNYIKNNNKSASLCVSFVKTVNNEDVAEEVKKISETNNIRYNIVPCRY